MQELCPEALLSRELKPSLNLKEKSINMKLIFWQLLIVFIDFLIPLYP